MLATDALASVDGFLIMVHLTFAHQFGMILCQNSHDCNCSAEPCQDMFGSNAKAEGGMLGRVDAVHTSIEAQTYIGSLYAHSQVCRTCYKTTSQSSWRHH